MLYWGYCSGGVLDGGAERGVSVPGQVVESGAGGWKVSALTSPQFIVVYSSLDQFETVKDLFW